MFIQRPISDIAVGRPRRLVYGVGINDAPYLTTYCDEHGVEHRCPIYQRWRSLIQRVACPKFKATQPTYQDCTLEPSWYTFTTFRQWMCAQDWQDKQLDKDLLVQGNKHYGPDTCVFIDQALNKLLCLRGNARGTLPLGVSRCVIRGKQHIVAHCSFYGKSKNLGYFDTPEAAAEAYRKAKLAHIAELAASETNPRIKAALLRLF